MENVNKTNMASNETAADNRSAVEIWFYFLENSNMKKHRRYNRAEFDHATAVELLYELRRSIRTYIRNCFCLASGHELNPDLCFAFADIIFDNAFNDYLNSSEIIPTKIRSYSTDTIDLLDDHELETLANNMYHIISLAFTANKIDIKAIADDYIISSKFIHNYVDINPEVQHYYFIKLYEKFAYIMSSKAYVKYDDIIVNAIKIVEKYLKDTTSTTDKAVSMSYNYNVNAKRIIEGALSDISNYPSLSDAMKKVEEGDESYFENLSYEECRNITEQLYEAIAAELDVSVDKLESVVFI